MTVGPVEDTQNYLSIEMEHRVLGPGQAVTANIRDITPAGTTRPSHIYYMVTQSFSSRIVTCLSTDRWFTTKFKHCVWVDLEQSEKIGGGEIKCHWQCIFHWSSLVFTKSETLWRCNVAQRLKVMEHYICLTFYLFILNYFLLAQESLFPSQSCHTL